MERLIGYHVEWHPEAARWFCRGCNQIFADRKELEQHAKCEALLEPAEREMIARHKEAA